MLDPLLYVVLLRGFKVDVVKPVTLSPHAYTCCDDFVRSRSVVAFLSIGAQLVVVRRPYTQVDVESMTQLIILAVLSHCELG